MEQSNSAESAAVAGADPKNEASGHVPFEVFRALPKTDLHVHLDGSLRLETILELAKAGHVDLPADNVEGLRAAIGCGNNFGSLVEYLRGFDITLRVMQTEAALERIAFELAEDSHRENVRYIEVRYAPMLHTRQGLKLTKVVEAVLAGLRRARETYGIKANVILCGIRNISAESSYQMAELAVAYKGRGVVGFDLAGAEADFPPKHHRAAFQLVRDNNINCTIHAGEAYGPESIAQAIHVCIASVTAAGCVKRATCSTT
jgi:adenosine deaminase